MRRSARASSVPARPPRCMRDRARARARRRSPPSGTRMQRRRRRPPRARATRRICASGSDARRQRQHEVVGAVDQHHAVDCRLAVTRPARRREDDSSSSSECTTSTRSRAQKSAIALANPGSPMACSECVATGSSPRASLCSPCAPPSKRPMPPLDAELDRLVVARLEVQAGHVFGGAPIASPQRRRR